MATSYTSLLGFALPVTGELSGTWGDVVNQSITELVEDAIAGSATADVTSADWTLTTTGSGAVNQARSAILIPTGTPGTTRNIIAPSSSKAYIVDNQSDGAVVVKGAATTGATVAAGTTALVAWDGSDFVLVAQDLANAQGTLAVAKGGTGITSFGTGVATALGQNVTGSGGIVLASSPTLTTPNLGTPSVANLTNATGLPIVAGTTGTLPVNRGGTGVTTSTGSGNVVLSTSPSLTTPNLGTPSAANLTNATGLPIVAGTTGTLPVNRGGTGATSLTANNVLLGNGTSAPLTVPPGTSGNVLTSNGTTWTSAALPGGNPGTVTSVSGTGTVNGITLTGTVTSSGNLVLGGALTGVDLTSQVTGTLPTTNGGTGNTNGTVAKVATTNFSIEESGGKLVIKYGATTIASISSTGVLTTLSDITSNDTP